MIKFFRKIRQKMLSENKFSKYLLYATGEIVLVVIGILIALSINNLNESRKVRLLVDNYLILLKVDLEKDISVITGSIDYMNTSMKLDDSFIERLKSPKATVDTLLLIMTKEFNPKLYLHRNFNNNTFETLSNTGDIGKLEGELALSLNELNQLQERVVESAKSDYEFYRSNFKNIGKSPASNLSKIKNGPVYDLMVTSIDSAYSANYFDSQLVIRNVAQNNALIHLKKVLAQTRTVLRKIEK